MSGSKLLIKKTTKQPILFLSTHPHLIAPGETIDQSRSHRCKFIFFVFMGLRQNGKTEFSGCTFLLNKEAFSDKTVLPI